MALAPVLSSAPGAGTVIFGSLLLSFIVYTGENRFSVTEVGAFFLAEGSFDRVLITKPTKRSASAYYE